MTDLLSLSVEKGQTISRFVGNHRDITRLLASGQGIANAENTANTRARLLQHVEVNPELLDVILLKTDGTVRLSASTEREGEDLSSLEHFIHGKQGTYVGRLHVAEGRKSYAIASPVRGEERELLGVLVAEFSLDRLYEAFLQAQSLGRTGEYLLLEPSVHGASCFNPRWRVFSVKGAISANARGRSKNTNTSDLMRRMIPVAQAASSLCVLAASGEEGILSGEDENGRQVLAAHHYLADLGIGIVVKVEERELFEPVRLLVVVLIGTTAIMLLLVAYTAYRISKEVVDPVLRLRESLQQLNTGHWTHKRSVFTGDELEILDKEAARLAVRLKEAYSSLEQRVEERTQELHAENAKDEALIESIGEGFLAIDMTGKIITCNSAAAAMLQWEKEQITNAHFSSVLNLRTKKGEIPAPSDHIVRRAMEEKHTLHTSPIDTYYCERHDGTRFPLSITATPFHIGEETKGIVVTFRDVSEEKRIDRMKMEFISLASHQLRTPLTAIGWYIELVQGESKGLTEDQQDYISQIIDSHKRMVNLVNALLNVSRIELGRLKIDPEPTNVQEMVDEIVKQLQPQMQEKKIQYSQSLPKKLKAFIDVYLVSMVLENLLSNAVKYTPDGGSIDLSVKAGKQEMQFHVRDTGMGIPQAQQHKIFEKLFRADNARKTETDGTGIGLYIAKSFAETWGGRLWFKSEENKGSTFSFTVPLKMKIVDETTEGTA